MSTVWLRKHREDASLNVKRRSIIILLLLQLRPKQWTKNLLIFAALIFSIDAISMTAFFKSIFGFFLFCFISGCVYILNDYLDIEADRRHPVKKYRPMASGELNPSMALIFGAVLLFVTLLASYILSPLFFAVIAVYFLLNISYSIKLKHLVIFDVMVIASGFVLRALAGGIAIEVSITPWFLLCIMLLSLFLAISKRRHEVILLAENKDSHRKVLQSYSPELLDQLNVIVVTATIISYSLFTFTSGNTIHLMWTIPIVIYGVFRYLYLIHIEGKGGSPENVLLEDRHILFTVIIYVISVILILSIF